MIFVHVMEMAIMQIVDMTFMAYCRMPTIGTVPVRMIRMMILIASGHRDFPFFRRRQTVTAFRQHARRPQHAAPRQIARDGVVISALGINGISQRLGTHVGFL